MAVGLWCVGFPPISAGWGSSSIWGPLGLTGWGASPTHCGYVVDGALPRPGWLLLAATAVVVGGAFSPS